MSPRILITISRKWKRWSVVREALNQIHAQYPNAILVHGDCPDGDRTVAGMWRQMGGTDEPWPARWGSPCTKVCNHKPREKADGTTYCPVPGPARNALMVESNPDMVLAFIRKNSKGATDCFNLAQGAGLNCREPYRQEDWMPKRIQRKREAGWRMPEGAVYVGRPTKWGNPYRWSDYPRYRSGVSVDGEWYAHRRSDETLRHWAMVDFESQYLRIDGPHSDAPSREEIRRSLAGKDLACWCPEGQACHADVLLRIANEEPS